MIDQAMLSSRCGPLLLRLRGAKDLNAQLICSSAALRAQRRSEASQSVPRVPPAEPEERLKHLKSAERKVAIFAGISMLIGYFALKGTFSDSAAKRRQQRMSEAAVLSRSKPRPLVVAGPSGSGKSTLLKKLFAAQPDQFGFSVSHTTRKPRPGEVNGREYHFTTREEMTRAIAAGEFIESAEYSGNLYGTSKKAVKDVLSQGRVCVLDIDMQGVRNLKGTDLNAVYVLIKPPSIEVLEQRLRDRNTETEESLKRRLSIAKEELDYASKPGVFDRVVVNDSVDVAYDELQKYIEENIGLKR